MIGGVRVELLSPATVVIVVCSSCTVLGFVSLVVTALYRSVI